MNTSSYADASLLLADLLPVGLMLSVERIIERCNPAFAEAFGYSTADLVGRSLEILYPSRLEFLDIGERWDTRFRDQGMNSDVRIMLAKGDQPVWCSVKGRCSDRQNPYALVACAFERLRPVAGAASRLSPREREIVAAIGEGLTSKEIARQLSLSYRTIETYRFRLMDKLGARNANHLLTIIGAP